MKRILFILTFILFSFNGVIYPQLPTNINHIFNNQFADGSSGKLIKVLGSNRTAPYTHGLNQSNTSTYHAYPVAEQTVVYNAQIYKQEFFQWLTSGQNVYTDEDLQYTTYVGYMNNNDINVPHTAYFHSLHSLTIRSNITWYGDHIEQVTINYKSNGETTNTPHQTYISDTNPISITFLNDFWYDNIHFYVNESNPKSFTANYNDANSLNLAMTHYGIPEWPSSTPRNLTLAPENSGSNARVKLTWQEHPNQYVSKYEIWRRVSGTLTSSKIAEVNRGTTSYIDPEYYYTYSGACTVQMVNYDVRAYYSIEQTTSPESFETARLRYPDSQSKSVSYGTTEIEDYSLSNYPNPFNPTTKIEYQLPQAGEVSIKVYNSLGKEVATLVNTSLSEGKYTTEFDGSNLSSGMYFYILRTNEKTIVNKMLLVK